MTSGKLWMGAAALACAGLMACGSSKKKTEKTTPAITSAPAPAADAVEAKASSEEATGDLRKAILELRRVHFGLDTAQLTEPSRSILTATADTLKKYPNVHIYVQGHADSLGTSEYNIALANQRADAVADYLAALGVDRSRLHTVSYGEERPLVSGHSDVDRATNRRVDFKVMRGDVELVVVESTLLDDQGKPIQ